jgi:hypothetical protein
MPAYPLGEVVAERELQLRQRNGSESAVRVRIGRPHPAGDDWQCPYEIEAQGSMRTMAIYGVDSIQALALTFTVRLSMSSSKSSPSRRPAHSSGLVNPLPPCKTRSTTRGPMARAPNSALLTDAFHSALRATRGAAKRERWAPHPYAICKSPDATLSAPVRAEVAGPESGRRPRALLPGHGTAGLRLAC